MDETGTTELSLSGEIETCEATSTEKTPLEGSILLKPTPVKARLTAGIMLALAISSVSSEIETSLWDRQHVDTSVGGLYENPSDHVISLAMARRVALRSLLWAEEQRRRAAEEEASYGIDWLEAN